MMQKITYALFALHASVVVANPIQLNSSEFGYDVYALPMPHTQRERTFYHLHNSFSPDGKFIVFDTVTATKELNSSQQLRKTPRTKIYSFEQNNYQYSQPLHNSAYSFSSYLPEDPIWSNDSKKLFLNAGGYYLDVQSQRVVRYANSSNLYWPSVSPSGHYVCGTSMRTDHHSGEGGHLACVDLRKPHPVAPNILNIPLVDNNLDVSHGWLGDDALWYYTGGPNTSNNHWWVVSRDSGSFLGNLHINLPNDKWYGKFNHLHTSDRARNYGAAGSGLIAGHTPGYYVANTRYTQTSGSDRGLRPLWTSNDEFSDPIGTHGRFNPNETHILVENVKSKMGVMAVYPLDANRGQPTWLARHRRAADINANDENTWRPYPQPSWSPDGTKVSFWSKGVYSDDERVYVAAYAKPQAPTQPTFTQVAGKTHLTFKAPTHRREFKAYRLYRQNGAQRQLVATLPVQNRYVQTELSAISSTADSMVLDTHNALPEQGYLEIAGKAYSDSWETVRYQRSGNTLKLLQRGALNSTASEHWNQAMVRLSTKHHGFVFEQPLAPGDYALTSVDWFGLESAESTLKYGVSTATPPKNLRLQKL